MPFLMALHDDFEPIRTFLLHRHPLPTFESAFQEVIFEETRFRSFKASGPTSGHHITDTVLATRAPQTPSQPRACRYCYELGRTLLDYPTLVYRICQKKGPHHFIGQCPKNPYRSSGRPGYVPIKSSPHHAAATTEVDNVPPSSSQGPASPSSNVTLIDIESMLKRVLLNSAPSTALFVTLGFSDRTDSWDRP
ncbi:hypothetical protein ACH5RR_041432 [Cinchona calisaya]|uniref:Uncharacterized protein n=1 Tax=Cinchona calisaya TaxID=153742 RepID=A0ABD2XYZ6_9GENT